MNRDVPSHNRNADEDLSEHRLKQEILVSPFKISLIFDDYDGKFAISQQK